MTDLRECPFCGGAAPVHRTNVVYCNECTAATDSPAEWNTRAYDAEIVALKDRIEKLERALKRYGAELIRLGAETKVTEIVDE